MVVQSINDISTEIVRRMPSGITDLDKIYGKTIIDGKTEWGLPRCAISHWTGASGCGKSRLGIDISKRMNAMSARIMVFQGEVRPEEFKQWTKAGQSIQKPDRFWVSDDHDLPTIISILRQYRPHLSIIDSANMVDGMEDDDEAKKVAEELKAVIWEIKGHLVLIGQQNQNKTVKGGTRIPHLVGVTARVDRYVQDPEKVKQKKEAECKNGFSFQITKNRFGPEGGWVMFTHTDDGIKMKYSSVLEELHKHGRVI